MFALAISAIASVASAGPGLGDDVDDLGVGEQPALPQLNRDDALASLIPPGAPWGSWKDTIFCSDGDYAVGYEMRVDSPEDGDNTALNSVRLICQSKLGGNWYKIMSHPGGFGEWRSASLCTSPEDDRLVSARLRVALPQGSGDDTAANDIQFKCSKSGQLAADGGGDAGSWNDWHACPAKTAICGLSIRYEDFLGESDDTAMNGIKLWCCTL